MVWPLRDDPDILEELFPDINLLGIFLHVPSAVLYSWTRSKKDINNLAMRENLKTLLCELDQYLEENLYAPSQEQDPKGKHKYLSPELDVHPEALASELETFMETLLSKKGGSWHIAHDLDNKSSIRNIRWHIKQLKMGRDQFLEK